MHRYHAGCKGGADSILLSEVRTGFGLGVVGEKCVLHELAACEHPLDGFMCNGELCMTVLQQQHRL